jgi:hypothetical protein
MVRSRVSLFLLVPLVLACRSVPVPMFGGLSDLALLRDARTRSISAENRSGEKGAGARATEGTGARAARELGRGWKVSPSLEIAPGATVTLADIAGPGTLQHLWITLVPIEDLRAKVLRFTWDDAEPAAVEVPLGDFFASGIEGFAPIQSLAVCVNPAAGFNCYWPMPFKERARLTLENRDDKPTIIYYQLDYELADVPAEAGYFHARFREERPVATEGAYTVLEPVRGPGQYVGTAMTFETEGKGWWGEGEFKFFLDGDGEWPTISGTGTEDDFGGSHNFDLGGRYGTSSTPYSGLTRVTPPERIYEPGQRFAMYRWHVTDPIRFEHDLRVTVQVPGDSRSKRTRARTPAGWCSPRGPDGARGEWFWGLRAGTRPPRSAREGGDSPVVRRRPCRLQFGSLG